MTGRAIPYNPFLPNNWNCSIELHSLREDLFSKPASQWTAEDAERWDAAVRKDVDQRSRAGLKVPVVYSRPRYRSIAAVR